MYDVKPCPASDAAWRPVSDDNLPAEIEMLRKNKVSTYSTALKKRHRNTLLQGFSYPAHTVEKSNNSWLLNRW